ncbi:hypothetical protein QWT87_18920 [Chryseobacterium sp. APV1]|jgi:hypothetical protein|uniref:Uncharacterized protein n=1 Tax=Chryseobacterium urinae TaxID=3058400 RepID=A0ABT8U7A1_9FLAO|nr:hypothetical protein [Chryseobacterium sp. APV1]MDO3426956.1 hypothetical protein [Chryseobacterium sp. APV1]
MKNLKKVALAAIFAGAFFFSPKVEAKRLEWAYYWDNGCVGKQIYHSALFGLFEWYTYEVISCPEGVSAPTP